MSSIPVTQNQQIRQLIARIDNQEKKIQNLESLNAILKERISVLEFCCLDIVFSIYDMQDFINITHGPGSQKEYKMFPNEVRKYLQKYIVSEIRTPLNQLHSRPFNDGNKYLFDSAKLNGSNKTPNTGADIQGQVYDPLISDLLKLSIQTEAANIKSYAKNGYKTSCCKVLDEIEGKDTEISNSSIQKKDNDKNSNFINSKDNTKHVYKKNCQNEELEKLSKKYKYSISRDKNLAHSFNLDKHFIWIIPLIIICIPLIIIFPIVSLLAFIITHPRKSFNGFLKFLKDLFTLNFSETLKDISTLCNSCFPMIKQIAIHRKKPKIMDIVGGWTTILKDITPDPENQFDIPAEERNLKELKSESKKQNKKKEKKRQSCKCIKKKNDSKTILFNLIFIGGTIIITSLLIVIINLI